MVGADKGEHTVGKGWGQLDHWQMSIVKWRDTVWKSWTGDAHHWKASQTTWLPPVSDKETQLEKCGRQNGFNYKTTLQGYIRYHRQGETIR